MSKAGSKGKKSKARPESEPAHKLSAEVYDAELLRLQVELCKLQRWVRETGERAIIVFEGRDAAGKGGIIKRITERVSPRVFRVVALPAPSSREKTQLYVQRYIEHFPAAGEVVIFDRSWYNRAGVERVLGFCTEEQVERFYQECTPFEHSIVRAGLRLIKYYLEVSFEEQRKRFRRRITDPTKFWKLSPTDLDSQRLWYEYSRARDEMFARTHSPELPWHIVQSDDKKRARLNCIAHLLSMFPYDEVPFDAPEIPERDPKHEYDDVATMRGQNYVPSRY
ncbi:MAG: polyphosphate kinase 2 [Phycisphaerales bacterium]